MKEQKTPKKPLIYYCLIAVSVLLLLNTFFFPVILGNHVTETTYSDMLKMLDEGKIKEAALDENQTRLIFYTQDETGKKTWYETGVWPNDTTLSERLYAAGVSFSAEIPTQTSPMLSFIISWVLPIVIFVGLGQLLMRRMGNMAGGAERADLRQIQRQDLHRGGNRKDLQGCRRAG